MEKRMCKVTEKIKQGDLWFDTKSILWRPVSDSWIGERVGKKEKELNTLICRNVDKEN